MAKREKQKAKILEEEEGSPPPPREYTAAIVISDEDDEEANEDLSLKIVEKAILMQKKKLIPNGGVVGGGDVVDAAAETVAEGLSGIKKKKKKRKVQKIEINDQSVIVSKEEEKLETNEKPGSVEAVVKEGSAEATVVLSGDPEAAEVSDNIVLRRLLRGPRYFDPPDSGWSTCYNCGEEGHMAVNCKSLEKKRKPCFVCGSLDHGVRQCSKGQDCFICKKGGHRAKDCPEKYSSGRKSSRICLRCGDSGHEMFSCRNDYHVDDLKEIQCYICKRFGHLCCVDSTSDDPLEVSCYKCGESGHIGMMCSGWRDEGTLTASPGLCYKCGDEGHFARECTSSAKAGRRAHESGSSLTLRAHKESKSKWGPGSASNDLNKSQKRRKTKSEKRDATTPQKTKHRGGWIMDDPEYLSEYEDRGSTRSRKSKRRGDWIMDDYEDIPRPKPTKNHQKSFSTPSPKKHRGDWIMDDYEDLPRPKSTKNHHKSFSTPSPKRNWTIHKSSGNHMSGPNSSRNAYKLSRSPYNQDSTPGYHHRFSASRFGNSSNGGKRRDYDWW